MSCQLSGPTRAEQVHHLIPGNAAYHFFRLPQLPGFGRFEKLVHVDEELPAHIPKQRGKTLTRFHLQAVPARIGDPGV